MILCFTFFLVAAAQKVLATIDSSNEITEDASPADMEFLRMQGFAGKGSLMRRERRPKEFDDLDDQHLHEDHQSSAKSVHPHVQDVPISESVVQENAATQSKKMHQQEDSLVDAEPFQVKVSAGGRELCLSETQSGHHVRALHCDGGVAPSNGQRWYWHGSMIKNMNSDHRCLGHGRKQGDGKAHELIMHDCGGDYRGPGWSLDEQGRLQSADTGRCMAIQEDRLLSAITLPCGESQ